MLRTIVFCTLKAHSMRTLSKVVVCWMALLSLTACDNGEFQNSAGEVNLYSSRHYDTDIALYDDFTRDTGIQVNRIEAGADELIARIQSEGLFTWSLANLLERGN